MKEIQDPVRYRPIDVLQNAVRAHKDIAAVLDKNLASKDVEGYVTRERLILQNGSSGVKTSELMQRIDENLMKEIRQQGSQVNCTDVIDKYRKNILDFFGARGEKSSFSHIGGEMANKLMALKTSPGEEAFSEDALKGLMDHASSIKQLSSKIKNLQAEIGNDITNTVDSVNKSLSEIAQLNHLIKRATENSNEFLTCQDQRRVALQVLAEQINIRVNTFNINEIEIFDGNGNILLQGEQVSNVSYDNFNNDGTLTIKTIDLRTIDLSETLLGDNQTGRLSGLMQLHGKILPGLQAQLDEYTRSLRDSFNKIHNLGVSIDPPSILTGSIGVPGSAELTGGTVISGSGTVRIGSVDSKTGKLAGYTDILLKDNMTVQDLISAINSANPSSCVIASITSDGRFQLEAETPSLGVVIGSVGESSIASLSASATYDAGNGTNLSHFFGLNNLFETGTKSLGGPINGISSSISVRKDITESLGNRISRGKLSNKSDPYGQASEKGDVSTISLLSEAYRDSNTLFNNTPISAATRKSLTSFADGMVDLQKKEVERTAIKLIKDKSVYTGLSKAASDISSVNEEKVLFDLLETNKSIDVLTKAMLISNKMNDAIFNLT
jgi:flagellar hook-associated protein 1 FlgK